MKMRRLKNSLRSTNCGVHHDNKNRHKKDHPKMNKEGIQKNVPNLKLGKDIEGVLLLAFENNLQRM
jgi:hypothetical protein